MTLGEFKRRFADILFLRKHSASVDVGLSTKFRMWLNGFVSEAYVLHSFARNDMSEYVNDLVRLKKACKFNGYYSLMLLDKLYFSKMLTGFHENLATIFGLICDRQFHHLDSGRTEPVEAILEVCRSKGAAVIKPIVGTRGEGIHILVKAQDNWMLNGRPAMSEQVVRRMADLRDYMVTEFVRQHQYARAIFESSANTIRILTLWQEGQDRPFIAAAVHRFGTSDSAPVDNWTLGGLSAGVDVETGRLGKALSHPKAGKIRVFDEHPETGSAIEDIQIPHWDSISKRILEMAVALSFTPYIGWDLVVTDDGFKVIEANNTPGINLMQVHEPLLRDARVKEFYEKRVAIVDAVEDGRRRYKLPFKV
ncbi:MAG: hypothetical protein J7M40_18595 [Planctomycetes bacterium]|nr:hypothetical protein [Planctomycetota bacterium]